MWSGRVFVYHQSCGFHLPWLISCVGGEVTAELDILKIFPAEGGQSVLRDRVMGVGGTLEVRFDSSPCFRLSCVVYT